MKRTSVFWFALAIFLASCSSKQNSTSEERLKWNTATLVDVYDRLGRKDPKWDAAAREALSDYAKIRSGSDFELETRLYLIGRSAQEAVKAGCDDAMIQFLYCRYWVMNSAKPIETKQQEFRSMVRLMEDSGYSPLRKFYAHLGAAQMLWNGETDRWPEVREMRSNALNNLMEVVSDKNTPVEEVYHATHALFQVMERSTGGLTNSYYAIEKPLFKNWPHAATSYLLKGEFYFEYAWRLRGNGTADKVRKEQFDQFFGKLAEAEKALNKAWSLNPQDPLIPTLMISVAEGQEKKRSEMEGWFDRAMKLNPKNYPACQAKLHFLSPQWHGSRQEMVAFGRECVASTNWSGKVPLILVDAHRDFVRLLSSEDRDDYWRASDVWPDIKAGYEKFGAVNPDETRFRYPYAWYAFRCGRYAEFLEQINALQKADVDFNYDYFGGKVVLEQAMESARQHTTKN